MTKSQEIEKVKELGREYGVRIYFYNRDDKCHGFCSFPFIHLNMKYPCDHINTFFHELGHYFAFMENKWEIYHKIGFKHKINRTNLKKYIATAWKAERWVDKWAAKEMKKWFPNKKFDYYYNNRVYNRGAKINFYNSQIQWAKDQLI